MEQHAVGYATHRTAHTNRKCAYVQIHLEAVGGAAVDAEVALYAVSVDLDIEMPSCVFRVRSWQYSFGVLTFHCEAVQKQIQVTSFSQFLLNQGREPRKPVVNT
ncbi:MAG: hypothetical protein FRX49_12209 [Trebouxia sp. A1-2]|nr:MAG: hypothetical protein FRX49_12209 [Trebouxia sp. A1-2]